MIGKAAPDREQLTMALCAIRYTIGRQSYIVADGVLWARKYSQESSWVRGVVIADLQEAVAREDGGFTGALGSAIDSKTWRMVLAELLVIEAKFVDGHRESDPQTP
jgi:hypothetical protein